jgi:hypothetical protein
VDSCAKYAEASLPSKAIGLAAILAIDIHCIGVYAMGTLHSVFLDAAFEWQRTEWLWVLVARSYGFLSLFEIAPEIEELLFHKFQFSRSFAEAVEGSIWIS